MLFLFLAGVNLITEATGSSWPAGSVVDMGAQGVFMARGVGQVGGQGSEKWRMDRAIFGQQRIGCL